jgi:phosphoglucosamine mutase
LLCDETGTLIDGDDIMAIIALELLASGSLSQNTLATTIMSNGGLDAAIAAAGGKTVRTIVGDQNVLAAMLKDDLNFGGEQSGHIIVRDYATTGDGLIAALQILRVMKSSQKPLSELARCWTRFPQLLTNIDVREKKPLESLGTISGLLAQAEACLQPLGGRLLLRYSGTEPKIRLLLEGPDAAMLQEWNQKLSRALKAELG